MASVSVYMGPEELARRAELVVEGTVTRTASGYDLRTGELNTYVTLEVSTMHRGVQGLRSLVLREAGGRYGDLVHVTDAAPNYRPGERVLVFLESSQDGALRTAGMFFGKFRLEEDDHAVWATRRIEGQQAAAWRFSARRETLRRNDLVALAASEAGPRRGHAPLYEPPGLAKLLWDDVRSVTPTEVVARQAHAAVVEVASLASPPANDTHFTHVDPVAPARWDETDVGEAVQIHVEAAGNPLGDDALAVLQVRRAAEAWTELPEARVSLTLGDTDYRFTELHAASPHRAYSGVNVVLFGDPYDDIPAPANCSGVLAVGGYWRSESAGVTVNGVAFHPVLQMYVIFNDDFECVLEDPDNLAEVAAHEMGHGLGFGHSTAVDSIMRANVYHGRGPRLGGDDRDAAHCHYPHTFRILAPEDGESWSRDSDRVVRWESTPELGADPGQVDLELSTDGGVSWGMVAEGIPNDGDHTWRVDAEISDDVLLRLSRGVVSQTGEAESTRLCSAAISPRLSITPSAFPARPSESRQNHRGSMTSPRMRSR